MARVDYDPTPTVSADTTAPDDLQRIQASPSAFGAQVDQALGDAGQGLTAAAQFYGKVATDEATTNYLEGRQKILYGDLGHPAIDAGGNPILGPDGSPVGQGGFYSLRGTDAIAAAPKVQQQLQQLSEQQLGTLQMPESRHEFTIQTRRYEAQELEKMGSFVDQQYRVWGTATNSKGITIAQNAIVTHLNDPTALAQDREDMRKFYVRNSVLLLGHDPDAAQAAVIQADRDWARTQIIASLPNNAPNAKKVLDANQNILAAMPGYDELWNQVKEAVFNQTAGPASDAEIANGLAQAKAAVGASATVDGGDVTGKILAVEGTARNPASSAFGPGQFVNSTFRQYIGAVSPQVAQQIEGMSDSQLTAYRTANAGMLAPLQTQMTQVLTRANQQSLQRAGVPVTDGNTYMAHVFGAGGTEAAIHAGPNALAAPLVGGADRLTKNGLPANATVGQVQAWADRKMGSTGSYPTTTDALMGNREAFLNNAQAHAESIYPGDVGSQERYMGVVERKYDRMISQQNQQYQVDAHIVQDYVFAHGVISSAQLENAPPNIVAAWHSVLNNNPLARASIEHGFAANAIGRAEGLGTGFKDKLDRVLAPPRDPNRISDPSQMWGLVGYGPDATLTNSGVDALTKLSTIRGTPKGEADAAMIRTFVDRIHDSLTYSNPATGLTDPKGEALFNKWVASVLPELINSQKQGTLGNVLNPQSKDFIGSTVQPFMRTPAQVVRDRLANEGVKVTAQDDPSTIQGLRMMVMEGKIDAEEAAWIANKRGFKKAAVSTSGNERSHVGAHDHPPAGLSEAQYEQWARAHDPLAGAAAGAPRP